MARVRVGEALGERWAEAQESLVAVWERFRESRLYVQTVCTAVLVGSGWLAHLAPIGPLAEVESALRWSVTADYDFRAKALQAQAWASGRGGWLRAAQSVWSDQVNRVQELVGPVGPLADSAVPAAGVQEAPDPPGPGASSPSLFVPPLLPVDGSVLFEFGWLPPGAGDAFHEGIDFLAKAGEPVVAVLDGTVVAVRQDPALGAVVEVRHGDMTALYGQLEAVSVRAGDTVRRGQPLAAVGRAVGSEQSLPPHLHFELRPVETQEPVDPASYLGLGGKRL